MTDDDRELCGEPNKTGGACKNPATNPDGSCHIPSHGPGESEGEFAGGRPSKLTPERQEAMCADLEAGHSSRVVAETNGVDVATYHRWRKKGKAAKENGREGPYRDFYERTTRAKRQGERKWAERAYKYAVEADSFGAVMEILRKRYPESWTNTDEDADPEDRLRVMLSDDRPADAERDREYAMTPEDADDAGND